MSERALPFVYWREPQADGSTNAHYVRDDGVKFAIHIPAGLWTVEPEHAIARVLAGYQVAKAPRNYVD